MENNQRNPRRRLNSLILLVAFTAVMLIVSTYAWFSSQKNVTVHNLEGKVNVAEGLMISLDAENWSQEVDFEDYDTTTEGIAEYGTEDGLTTGKNLAKVYGTTVHNNIPTELLPVSTTGKEFIDGEDTVTGSQEIAFYNGTNINEIELYQMLTIDPTETSALQTDYPGYFAIDLFLQNSSKIAEGETQGTTTETLQLNTNSLLQLVTGGSEITGLQNTVRLALAMYTPISGASKTSAADDVESSVYVTANQDQILAAYEGAEIGSVAIWEPNADQHVDYVVKNNNRITWNSTVKGLYLLEDVGTSGQEGYIAKADRTLFLGTERIPTYALTEASLSVQQQLKDYDATTATDKVGIANIYKWDDTTDTNNVGPTTAGKLERQIALQTKKGTDGYEIGTVRNLITTASSGEAVYDLGKTGDGGEAGAQTFEMLKNTIVKCRLYMWLEGQDVDCINYASHGSGVHLDLGLVKGATPGTTGE